MKIKSWVWVAITLLHPFLPLAQVATDTVEGEVFSIDENIPLIGANLFWLDTDVGTATDSDGKFSMARSKESRHLVVSYIGYSQDTIEVLDDDAFLTISLSSGTTLSDVQVVHRRKATEYSLLNPIKVEQINEKELLKAACCNLSESFETNPSIDVSFTDAVTGTRQIQMLGLAGPYIQISRESMPYLRGLASVYGLSFVPGTWIEGMQLSKGTGSVMNGFESIAGQINIELRKPQKTDKLYLNLYANEGSRLEANLNFSQKINDQWSTGILLHSNLRPRSFDRNNDGFRDMPTGDAFIALNRWQYIGDRGMRFQFGINTTSIDRTGGQLDYKKGESNSTLWGLDLDQRRLEGWIKMGKVYETIPWRSWALQLSASDHTQNSLFGRRTYDANHKSFYGNLLYQTILVHTAHQVLMGASLQHDDYREILDDNPFDRIESVAGGFFEYSYGGSEKFSLVAGIRGDVHNNYGFFVTPRLHFRYALTDQLVWRASLGRGLRTANIFSENNGLLASAREFIIRGENNDNPYGLDPEIAWNTGTNLVYTFQINQRSGAVSIDLYHTNFKNQIVVDLYQSAREVLFYNLNGKSYSNSFQAQLDYEVVPSLDIRFAYRWYDVKSTYSSILREKPLLSAKRFFVNLGYSTQNNWSFDFTVNWQGKKHLPYTDDNPLEYQLSNLSPSFAVLNSQIAKKWNAFELYLGGENLLNYRQKDPILSSEMPFSPYFDSSMTWGPIFGRNIYMGIRYRI